MLFCSIKGANRGYIQVLLATSRNRIYFRRRSNEQLLQSKGLKSGIQKKASKNNPLTSSARLFNKIVSKTRYKVERVFGRIRSWFRSYGARYIGIEKMHTQHVMEALAYNLYRSPNIILKGV